jgi:hypothetical protein
MYSASVLKWFEAFLVTGQMICDFYEYLLAVIGET